jgi:single-stranded-DNA-specific exonuclease
MNERLTKRWVVASPVPPEVSNELSQYPPVLRQLLYNRGIDDLFKAHQYLTYSGSLYDPFLLMGMETAVELVWGAIENHQSIAIYGDYDVDGVTASALLTRVLRKMGAVPRQYIPDRFEEGYGLNKDAVDKLAAEGIHLVITVDCGIRSPREVEHANRLGMKMIITDHHEPHAELPAASAVLCPRQPGDGYPDKNLAGVGVAFKLAQALLERHPLEGFSLAEVYDLVAVGTVADVVPLSGENRALVKAGLEVLRMGSNPGLRSLAAVAKVDLKRLTSRDIGFGLGPRLNAAGRLESALAAYQLLVSEDSDEIGKLAQELDDQNRKRQELTRSMQETAESLMSPGPQDYLLFSTHPDFNMGVVGLVASRLVDNYYRPSIVGARGETYTRASCRSIPEFHINHALDQCTELFERHGGHAMAAGFTIRNERVEELIARLKQIATDELADRDLRPQLHADMEIKLWELKPEILGLIQQLDPTGTENYEVLFVSRNLWVTQHRLVGNDSSHLKLTITDGIITYDCIAFRQGHWAGKLPEAVDLLYSYERNEYNGRVSLQLNIRDIQPSGG